MTARDFVARVVWFAVALAIADFALARRVEHHFLPEIIFDQATAAGDGALVTLGDSRMVAGTSGGVLGGELARVGSNERVAELAIGGTSTAAHYLAARRYLEDAGRKPKLIVLGTGLATLVADARPADPETFLGNEALVLGWSRASDVTLFYPDFPLRDFDPGFRFLAGRGTHLTAYASLAWANVQTAQNRLVNARIPEHNRFGLVTSMQALAETMQRAISERLPDFPEKRGVDPWFSRLLELVRTHRLRLVVVEVPMPGAYRTALAASPHRERVRASMSRLVRDAGGTYLSFVESAWIEERFFDDGVHLGPEGARRFSAELARALTAEPLLH